MPTGQQTVNVLGRVLQPVLVEHSGPAGQAHGSEAVVLGNDDISRYDPIDQGKVHAVGALVKDQRLGALPLDAVGRIAPLGLPLGSCLCQSKSLAYLFLYIRYCVISYMSSINKNSPK